MKNFIANKMNAVRDGMKDNKGFSLVELIIVVAIMAVLMGVLAPQYLRFVESSREQADKTAGDQIASVMTIALSTQPQLDQALKVTWGVNGSLTVAEAGLDGCDYDKEITSTLGTTTASITSVWAQGIAGTGGIVFGVFVDPATSVPYITCTNSDFAEAVGLYYS
ncbi:MAG: prepilin-type N-terminal cleavage/methylation domain-containing protein [Eubacteriales bacterium]